MLCGDPIEESPSELETVKKIEKYIFRPADYLGKGNFSTVYLGIDESTGKQVAIKIIKKDTLNSRLAIKLLENEVAILKNLSHPNVIKCFDVLTSVNNCYIVTQLCEHGDLEKILRTKGTFDEKELSKLVYDIYRGFEYLAKHSIIHRDFKIANIFLSNKTAKIADFGFAIKKDCLFKDINIGSPIYMTPQGLLKSMYSPKTDVWSFGIMLFQLTHGYTPLSKCKTQADLHRTVILPPKIKSSLSPELRKLIELCLITNESQRISTSQIGETAYMKRVFGEVEGFKISKFSSSTHHSTDMTLPECGIFRKQINYDTAVAVLHYCRLIHKTCRKVNSFILSQWLMKLSFSLSKVAISKQSSDNEQLERLKTVISEYHCKYLKEHEDMRADIKINEVTRECLKLRDVPDIRSNVVLISKETQLFGEGLNTSMEYFVLNSQSKNFLGQN